MTDTYQTFDTITPEEWTFSPVQKDKTMQSVWVNQISRKPIMFQMSPTWDTRVRIPFGVNTPVEGTPDTGRYNMSVSVDNVQLSDFISRIENHIKDAAVKNSTEWFKKPLTMAEIEMMFSPLMKPSPKDGHSPLLKVKVSKTGNRTTDVKLATFGDDGLQQAEGTLDDITPQSQAMLAITVGKIWFMNRQFGVTLNVNQALVEQNSMNTPVGGGSKMSFQLGEGIVQVSQEDEKGSNSVSPKVGEKRDRDELESTGTR